MTWRRYAVLLFFLITTTISTKIDDNSAWIDNNGLVRVKVSGTEGKICSTSWDDQDAKVLCRGLNKTKSKSYIKNDILLPTLIADVQCDGTESRLEDCQYSVVGGNATCTPPNSSWNSAGTYCYDSSDEVTYSLEHVRYGRVLATRNGYERYLCRKGFSFSYNHANVVCRDMGYKAGEILEAEQLSMSQTWSWWKNSFECQGNEPLLNACATSTWENITARDYDMCLYQTPAVLCHGAARLHTAQFNSSGVVGLYHDNDYRAICSDDFDSKAVAVVCNSLGFAGGYKAPSNSYSSYNYYTRIANLTCSGTEKSLDQCSYDYSTSPSCSGPATVACIDQNDPDSALPDGSTKIVDKKVLIKFHDIWGTICYDNWDDVDAKVFCKQHGFDDGKSLQLSHDNMKPRWYKNVTCQDGTDQTLETCTKDTDTDYCYYTFDAGVYCFNSTDMVTFSFTDSNSTNYGRLQITRDNKTHYLCDTSGHFNYEEMRFVCKEMGFITGQEYVDMKTPVYSDFWENNINCMNSVPSLDACTSDPWIERDMQSMTCQYNVPSIFCYGNVRLHSDFLNATGHLNVYKNDRYEMVCQNNFGSKQLNVVCKELGFHHSGRLLPVKAYRGYYTGYGNIPNGYTCGGNEKSITDCTSFDASPCDQPATVACFESLEEKLAGTGSVKMSVDDVVLMMVDGVWGTICSDGFDDNTATVMCKQQGYEHGVSIIKSERYEKPMLTKSVNCTGSETGLNDCQIDLVTDDGTQCSNDKRAGVKCYDSPGLNQYSLVDGDGYRYGRLMVTRNNKTGYVCSRNSYFDYNDANVLCKQLGFSEGVRYNMPNVPSPQGTRYWSNTIACSSNEPNVDVCMKDSWSEIIYDGMDTCPYHVPSVFCYGQVRLHTEFLATSGAVLVRHNDRWVSVCADGFDDNAARVVCGELGFVRDEGKTLSTKSFAVMYSPNILSLNCTGHENFISECNSTYNETSGICDYDNYAVVSCKTYTTTTSIPTSQYYPQTTYNSIEPIASSNQSRWLSDKRVSLFVNGMWSGICRSGWDDIDANVFCKELGFDKGKALVKHVSYNQPRYRYNIRCSGTESSIMHCPYENSDVENGTCYYYPDAAAFCYNTNSLTEMRLVGGQKPNSGRVEVKRGNKWGWFCGEGFQNNQVNVICNQLGYKSGDKYSIDVNETNSFMWRTSPNCEGTEPFIDACDNQYWSYEDYGSWCQSNPRAVFCYGEVRLHTGFYNKTGVVEVYMDNNYYSLCADDFSTQNAEVVCRQLGFTTTAVRILPPSSFQQQRMTSRINYSCNGTESNLAECPSSNDPCSSDFNHVVLSCGDGTPHGADWDIKIDSDGYVSILHHGIWGRICGLSWDNKAAQVACKQIGYETGLAYGKYLYDNTKPLWVDGVDCYGSEQTIKDCQITTQLNSTCSYADSAFAYCYNSSTESTYSIIGGNSSNSGYVETDRDGKQGYVCDTNGYYNYEADAVCRSLGYAEGDNYPMDQLPITANFWTNSFNCYNKEPTLHICAVNQWSYISLTNDTYNFDLGRCRSYPLSVFCYNKVRLHSKFRNSSGIVLQNRDGRKYRYCADHVDLNTASAICKQVGFDNARAILPSYAYDHLDPYRIAYHNLSCPSGAVKLDECTMDFDVNGTCDSGALAVSCNSGNSMPDGVTRILEDGTVEVSKYNVWGTINSVNWDDVDAKVVCKENGYESGMATSKYVRESPRWLYNVGCSGIELTFAACSYETRSYNDTEKYAGNAAVICYNPSEVGAYELENGNYGRLLITREGEKGYVCDPDYVTNSDRATACRTLGYENGESYPSPELPSGHLFWTSRFSCDSESPILESCMKSEWTNVTDSWSCSNYYTFSVYCYGKVRLHVAYRNTTGILLITDKNQQYSVCSEGFDMVSANVSCKEMGFVGVRRILPSYIYSNYRTIKYSNFQCNGNEDSLLDCPHQEQGCNGSYVVLECDDTGLPPISNYTTATQDYNNYNYTHPYNNWNNTDGYTPPYNNWNNTDGYTPHHNNWNNTDGYTPPYNNWNNTNGYTPPHNNWNNTDGYTPPHNNWNNTDGYTPPHNNWNNTDGYTPPHNNWNNTDGYTPPHHNWNNTDGYTPPHHNWNNTDGYTPPHNNWNNTDGYTPPHNNWNNTDGYTPLYNNGENTTGNSPLLNFIISRNNLAWERYNRRILVWENGQWNGIHVCNNDWDNNDASVACRELGYDEGVIDLNYKSTNYLPKSMFNVRCNGNELSLKSCAHENTATNTCNYVRYAAVFCYNSDNVTEVRLVDGNQRTYGVVQVKRNDTWHYYCDSYSSNIHANVICKQLGYVSGDMYEMDMPSLPLNTPVLRNYIDCDHKAYLIDQCTTSEWTKEMYGDSCQYGRLPTVYCYGNVRLSSGTDALTGTVSVYNGEYYEEICADYFGKNETDVVCRELGFPLGGKTLPSAAFKRYINSNYTYQCNGNEGNLSQCIRKVESCSDVDNAAVVACNDGNVIAGNDGDVKIGSDGEVLTFYHGVWGTICPYTWDDVDADVVCKQLGYLHGMAYSKNTYTVNKPRWVFDVDCKGTEAAFQSCVLKFSDTNSTCDYMYSESAMAYCYDTLDTNYSLTGGGANYGYIIMEKDSSPGYTCDKNGYGVNSHIASIVCRNLGFSSGEYYPMSTVPINSSFWMNDLLCYNIPLLELCNKEKWVFSNESNESYDGYVCRDRGTISVYCYGEVRLSGQYKNSSGIVVRTKDKEDKVAYCSDGFTIDMAGLICKDLGFTNQAKVLIRSYVFEHYETYPVRYSNVNCPSGAKSFSDCTYDYNTNTQCTGGALAIACDDGNSVTDNQIKILNDGTLQISKHGIWGTISGDNWRKEEADVVCKSEGYKAGLPRISGLLNSPRWLYSVECNGAENNIFDCHLTTSPPPNNNSTMRSNDAGVYCYDPATALNVTIEHGNYGRVQLTKDGITGYICGLYSYSYSATSTICKSKGYDYDDRYNSPVTSKDAMFWGYEFLNCDWSSPILDSCDQSEWYNGTLKDDKFSSCESNMLSITCKYYESDRNSSNSNSSVPPGGVTYPTNSSGNTTNINSGGNTTDSYQTDSSGNTTNINSGGNTTDSGVTYQTDSSGNTTNINSGGNTPDPKSTKPVPTDSSGNSGDTNSNPPDSNDASNPGQKSSAAIILVVRSCILLTIVVAMIGNF